MYRVAAAEALRWGVEQCASRSTRARAVFVPAGQPLVGGLCDTGVRGFWSGGKASGCDASVSVYCSSDISYLVILSYLILSYLILFIGCS